MTGTTISKTPTTRNQARLSRTEVLVVDFFTFLWEMYEAAIPSEYSLMIVPDTERGLAALPRLTGLHTIIIQGWSRRRSEDPHQLDLSEGPHTTFDFIEKAMASGFTGQFLVVSNMEIAKSKMAMAAPGRVQVIGKRDFFACPQDYLQVPALSPFPARNELWARWERLLCKRSSEAEGPEMVLEWLEEFDQTIETGDARRIYEHFIQLGMEHVGYECDCLDPVYGPGWAWVHYHNHLLTQAVWEALAAATGLIGRVRDELEADLSTPDRFYDCIAFGRSVMKSYGERLRTFLREDAPDREWTTQIYPPREG
jgi:hypothetical protein